MTCEEAVQNLDAWLLGALEASEAAQVVAHLEGCAACRALAESRRWTVDRLALSAPLRTAPTALRAAVLSAIGAGSRPIPFPGRRQAAPAGVSAGDEPRTGDAAQSGVARWAVVSRRAAPFVIAAVLVLAVGVLSYRVTSLQSQVSSLERRAAQQSPPAVAPRLQDAVVLLAESGTVTAPLSWQGTGVAARGTAIWNPAQKQCLLLTRELEPPPPGFEYHVWFKTPEAQWDGGALPVDSGGEGGTLVSTGTWDTGYGYHITISLQKQGDPTTAKPILGGDISDVVQ